MFTDDYSKDQKEENGDKLADNAAPQLTVACIGNMHCKLFVCFNDPVLGFVKSEVRCLFHRNLPLYFHREVLSTEFNVANYVGKVV